MLQSSSICMSFLYNYLLRDSKTEDKDDNGRYLDKKCDKLKCLSDTLESYGGVLSKLSQMLSINDENSKIFSDCKPFSRDKTISYFREFITENSFPIENVDFDVYKSGSVGQVHKAFYNDKKIIFKVQYVGLAKQTRKDLDMLDKIIYYLYYFADMKNAMVDIKTKMFEELDYKMEASNQKRMYKIYKDSKFIEIPKIISKLSTDNVLCMYLVEGKCLQDFIENSTQTQRNKFGKCLVKFVFENIYKHGVFYSDIHYGNFLVKNDSTLYVLDFGCLHNINDVLMNHFKNLHKSILQDDSVFFYKTVEEMGIIDNNISEKSKKYIYEYFRIQYTPWISDEFEFTDEWLYMAQGKQTELMKEWILPHNIVYFNKIPHGMYHILTKLKLKGCFKKIFKDLL